MSIVLDLPRDILQNTFYFLQMRDIINFDTALTDSSDRIALLSSYKGLLFDKFQSKPVTDRAISWICDRGFNIERISLQNVNDRTIRQLAQTNENKLQAINISHNIFSRDFTNDSLCNLAKYCPGLQEFKIESCYQIDCESLVGFFKNCKTLKSVEITNCGKLSDKVVVSIAENCRDLRNLAIVNLEDPSRLEGITNIAVSAICKYSKKLENLDLSDWYISEQSLFELAQASIPLKSFKFHSHEQFSSEAFKVFFKGCSSLKHLNVHCCPSIDDSVVVALSESLPGLLTLDLSFCDQLTELAVFAISHGCRQIESLTLSYCTDAVSDAAIACLAARCPLLKFINLDGCSDITDEAIFSLIQGCKDLEEVHFDSCCRLTDRTPISLALYCQKLHSLSLNNCDGISVAAKIYLSRYSNLKHLSITNCWGMTYSPDWNERDRQSGISVEIEVS